MADFDPSEPAASPADDAQRTRRMDLRRKVSLKFKEFQGFVNEYSENVSTGGMFIRTPSPQPPGSVFDFEFTLGDDYTLIHGIGEVVWVREEDEGFDRPSGMGVRFLSLDPESRKLIDRMVQERLERRSKSAPAPLPDRPWDEAPSPEPEPAPGWDEVPAEPPAASPAPPAASLPPLRNDEPEDPEPAAGPPAPAPGGPSPYAYARSYGGSGVARRRRKKGPLLVALLVLALLVAALAAFFLFFPETAVRLLVGGDGAEAPRVAAERRPEAVAGPPEGGPVEPVPRSEVRDLLAPPETAPGEAPPETPVPEGEAGEPPAEEERELGFFAPAPDRQPPAEDEREPPPREPPAAPAPAPAPAEPAPGTAEEADAPSAFSRVLNIVWEEAGEEVLVTVHLDGAIEEWDYSTARIESPPPRELVRLEGVSRPFPRSEIPVGTDLLERIRIGFHPDARRGQIHVVLDLATPEAELARTEAAGRELRLYVARRDG